MVAGSLLGLVVNALLEAAEPEWARNLLPAVQPGRDGAQLATWDGRVVSGGVRRTRDEQPVKLAPQPASPSRSVRSVPGLAAVMVLGLGGFLPGTCTLRTAAGVIVFGRMADRDLLQKLVAETFALPALRVGDAVQRLSVDILSWWCSGSSVGRGSPTLGQAVLVTVAITSISPRWRVSSSGARADPGRDGHKSGQGDAVDRMAARHHQRLNFTLEPASTWW